MESKFLYDKDSLKYSIEVSLKDQSIYFLVKDQVNPIENISFDANFSLQNLIQKNGYFQQYETIDSLYETIVKYLQNNKYKIELKDKDLYITFYFIRDFDNIEIPLLIPRVPIKKGNPNELIMSSFKQLKIDIDNKFNVLNTKMDKLIQQNEALIQENKELKMKNEEYSKKFQLKTGHFEIRYICKEGQILENSKIFHDVNEIKTLKKFINSNFDKVKLNLLYDGKRDGDSASSFHDKCDNKGETLTLIELEDSKRIALFTSKSWDKNSGRVRDKRAFAYLFNEDKKTYIKDNDCCEMKGEPNYGPKFGCSYVVNNFFTNKSHFDIKGTSCSSYTLDNDLGFKDNFLVKYLEVFGVNER